ncbi:MAG: 4a-hydroxytetrahydrobiopterin dehydratase [Methanobacteriota archaeon]|nr:MAG: 4a-hydroxytetrahydrobiopterin dehydratase [Euryarchaeota archaeon]
MACEGGQPPLTDDQISRLMPGLDENWEVVEGHHLQKEWSFPDFSSALEFVNLAGGICEDEGHHADFELGWGRVKASIWTHKIDGLTESDFFLAAKFDRIER